ncbi:hypothetical protein BDW72DRAFT_203714 [Aspergillus terricola var. indicus]
MIVRTGSICVSIQTCASSICTATYEQMTAEFNTPSLLATTGLSSFVLGIGLGPNLVDAHHLDHSIGVGTNIETLIAGRFFQGFAGGTFLSVAGGTVGDIFVKDEIQKPMAVVSLAPFVGPTLGPVLGGFIHYNAQRRWTYYFVMISSGILLVLIVLLAPETRVHIKARHESESEPSSSSHYHEGGRSPALSTSLFRPFQMLLTEPMCLCLDLYSAILLGTLYLFFGAFSFGLTFLGIIAGMLVAAASNPIWNNIRVHLMSHDQEAAVSRAEPEHQLLPAILGSSLIPIGLFWFGWTMNSTVRWIVPILGSAVFGCGMVLVFTGVFTYLVDAYPQYTASALAGNGFVRCTFAAAFPLFGNQMYEKLGYQWATSVLAFLTFAMMPFPDLFFKYGKALRNRSRLAIET